MNYQFSPETDIEKFDNFVANHHYASIFQQSLWPKIKTNWQQEYFTVKTAGRIVAAALALVKTLPLGYKIYYLPKGPVLDFEDGDLVRFFFMGLKDYCKKHKVICVKFDTLYPYRTFTYEEKGNRRKKEPALMGVFEELGIIHLGYNLAMNDVTQARIQAVFYYYPGWRNQLNNRLIKLLSIAERRGVELEETREEGLEVFAGLMAKTRDRKGVSLRNKDYFGKLLTVYGSDSALFLTKVDLKSQLAKSEKELADLEEQLADPAITKRKTQRIMQQLPDIENDIRKLRGYLDEDGPVAYLSGGLSL